MKKIFIFAALMISALNVYASESKWFSCENVEHCTIILGAGGWPVGLNRKYTREYAEWLERVRPYTEFYQVWDCFSRENEIRAYFESAGSSITCKEAKCIITVQPECSVPGAQTR